MKKRLLLSLVTLFSLLTLPSLPAFPAFSALPAPPAQKRGRLFPPLNLGVLEGADREQWQKPEQIMDALKIADGSIVAEIGAASGWFTLRLAHRVNQNGLVLFGSRWSRCFP